MSRAGNPIAPGVYFRMHLVGFFEGIESERGLEWRFADSLSLRQLPGLALTQRVLDHSTLSRTRQRLPLAVHQAVFALILGIVETKGLLQGRVVGVDSTYLRADASGKAIGRRDTERATPSSSPGWWRRRACRPHGRGGPPAGSDAQGQEDFQPRVGVAHRSRRRPCQAEGWPYPLGLQPRARGGPGDRRHPRSSGAPGGCGRSRLGGDQSDRGRGQPADGPGERHGDAG